jgi:poly-gamma-glutamate synthesis protein (capsule biosynthesis protein)
VNVEVVTPRPPLIPSAEHGGSNLGAPEFVLDELSWMGFNLFNVANNHSNDYTFHGLIDTMDALKERGMTFAGGGMNLGEARSPAYFDTKDARVAVLGASSTYVVGAPAGPSREDMPGRPGISHIRVEQEHILDRPRWDALNDIYEAMGLAQVTRERQQLSRTTAPEGVMDFLGNKFVLGSTPGVVARANPTDIDDICRWISDARRQAEFVVMSLHAHQGKNRRGNSPELADFLPEITHRFIDAGADVVVGHGPHMLRAIEVYKGKPIFYSLGDFYYVSSGIQRYPAEIYLNAGLAPNATPADIQDNSNRDKEGRPRGFAADARFWQAVVPVCKYREWELESVDLHPIWLNFPARHRSQLGEPYLASVEMGTDILEQLQVLCEPLGTRIEIVRNGEHVVGRMSW